MTRSERHFLPVSAMTKRNGGLAHTRTHRDVDKLSIVYVQGQKTDTEGHVVGE